MAQVNENIKWIIFLSNIIFIFCCLMKIVRALEFYLICTHKNRHRHSHTCPLARISNALRKVTHKRNENGNDKVITTTVAVLKIRSNSLLLESTVGAVILAIFVCVCGSEREDSVGNRFGAYRSISHQLKCHISRRMCVSVFFRVLTRSKQYIFGACACVCAYDPRPPLITGIFVFGRTLNKKEL